MSYDYADSEVDASIIADLRKRVAEVERKIIDLAHNEDVGEPLDDAIGYAISRWLMKKRLSAWQEQFAKPRR